MNILIVDDQPINLKVLGALLAAEGHAVRTAANGVEALAVLEGQAVDAIISDILMPTMDGCRLCYEVRSSERLRHLPFIFYTASYTSPGDEKLCYDLGADQYLRKPASSQEIIAALQEVTRAPRRPRPLPAGMDEGGVLKEYSERLVSKLEEKNIELAAAVDELRRARNFKAGILDSSLDSVIAIDHEGKIVEFNSAAEALFGVTRAQALGELMVELIVPPRLRDAHRRGFVHYLATGEGPVLDKRVELEAIRVDGTEFPIEISIRAIRAGSNPMFTAFVRDITERKRAEGALLESERRFSDMLRNLDLVSVMLDEEGRVTYCNKYLLELTGWLRSEVLGRDWFELFSPPENPDPKRVFKDLLAGVPSASHNENEILTRSGERRRIHWNNTVLRSGSGRVIGTASIGEDITTRRQAEEVQKRRADDLEKFHRLSVGRELQMIELKREVNRLAVQAGGSPAYPAADAPKAGADGD